MAKKIKNKIKTIRKQSDSFKNKKEIKRLYNELDRIQFKPDYACVIMDRNSDYRRLCKGFSINGVKYTRLLGTNGGVKNSTIVFVSERVGNELKRRIENDRAADKALVPAKLEAYKALTCSGSTPVSFPKGVLVVDDCVTHFKSDVLNISDEADGEPVVTPEAGADIELTESDGYGLMSPELAARWSEELHLDYVMSGANTRFAWEKGMVYAFDFIEFGDKIAGKHIVKDAWGNDIDITKVELVLTTSMVKLWDSYDSCEHYLECCRKNGYTFRVTKTCPKELESERDLNYQFIQSYKLNDTDIDELIEPTISEIKDVLGGDYRKTILFLRGVYLTDDNVDKLPDDFSKAIMVDKRVINDPFIRGKVHSLIKKRIDCAKVGVIKVHGNYSMVSGDPYSLCQSMFGLPVTGLLKAGEIYNKYWADLDADDLVCFRAPMTCHNNIQKVHVANSNEIKYWYRHMQTCTIFNSWDCAAHALNGMDKDGDLVMLTDNPVLLRNYRKLPTLMCIQRRAEKKVVHEEDLIQANINSFGDEIGKITNRITSMFEVQSHFSEDSPEYKELEYRIMCGQNFQQNAIDKAKGIISKPMPKEWYDRSAVRAMDMSSKESIERHNLYLRIIADKKPYFMIYIYPALKMDYNKYIKNANRKCLREFRATIDELELKDNRTEAEEEFVKHYLHRMPVGLGGCVMNTICRKIEAAFGSIIKTGADEEDFDYSILKSDTEYSKAEYYAILSIYNSYLQRTQDYKQYASMERVDTDEAAAERAMLVEWVSRECRIACPDSKRLCNIVLDICYQKSSSKQFAWDVCGHDIIENLLDKNDNTIHFPISSTDGEVKFGGKQFVIHSKKIGGELE